MDWTFDDDRPIYIQLVEQLTTFIIRGDFSPSERLPSVRDLAQATRVNPNTMQKALAELEESGLVKTERTSGKFVTDDAQLIEKIKVQKARLLASDYFLGASRLGLTAKQAKELVNNFEEEK